MLRSNRKRFQEAKRGLLKNGYFTKSAAEITTIPGSPVAYWLGSETIRAFRDLPDLKGKYETRSGIMTGNDSEFLRIWHEVELSDIREFGLNDCSQMTKRFFPMSKGGSFRRWYWKPCARSKPWNGAEAIKASEFESCVASREAILQAFCNLVSNNIQQRWFSI